MREGILHDNQGGAFRIRNVRLFDGHRVQERMDVIVRQGRIVNVAKSNDATIDCGSVNGTGKTLLPGLIDAHVHAWPAGRRDALRFGVTTELDMFSDWRQIAEARTQREGLARSELADLWSAGTPATADGGHGTQFGLAIPTLTEPYEAFDWVAARVSEGSDYIKIIHEDRSAYSSERLPTLDEATVTALIQAAHEHDRLAVLHVSVRHFSHRALAARIDGLMHIFHDLPADKNTLRLACDSGAFVVPTLTLIAAIAGEGNGLVRRFSKELSESQLRTLAAPLRKKRPHLIANARRSVRMLHQAGVRILAGTDAPNSGTAHGASIHAEIEELVKAGLSPEQALSAATSHPADAFGLLDRGRIRQGSRADLVLVDGDPTQDITATRAIVAVWKNGYVVERTRKK